jgi:hypothetical protein
MRAKRKPARKTRAGKAKEKCAPARLASTEQPDSLREPTSRFEPLPTAWVRGLPKGTWKK